MANPRDRGTGDDPNELGEASTADAAVVTVEESGSTGSGWPPPLQPGASPPRPLPTREASRYRILDEHGRGGLGRVLRAHDSELDRTVAIKELMVSTPSAETRFAREIRVTARLEHPGIVPVHDAGRWSGDGRSFYTMKLVAGSPLKQVIDATVTLEQRLAFIPNLLAITEAVAYAHSRGVIHRDLKPANVIVGEFGETIVIDWGLAKQVGVDDPLGAGGAAASAISGDSGDGAGVTVAGAVVGTPSFMSPEQARGEPVDARTDVYALGAVAYYVLTGRTPYQGPSSAEVIKRVVTEPPAPLRQLEPRIPVDLAAIVEKAMARDPLRRYPSARELAADLRSYQAGRFVAAREYAWWEPPLRFLRRHWLAASATAVALAFAVIGVVVAIQREQRLRHAAEAERSLAEAQSLALLEQQARRELSGGRPRKAAIYLAEALVRDPEARGVRVLLSQALTAASGHVRRFAGHEREVTAVGFGPGGKLVVSGSDDGGVVVWEAASGRELRRFRAGESIEQVGLSDDGTLVVAGDRAATHVWRVDDGAEVLVVEGSANAARLSPDGKRLWTGRFDGSARVIDVATGAELATLAGHDDRVIAFEPDPSGARVYSVSWDGRAIEWDAATMTRLRTIDDHRSPLRFLRFSPDGELMITGDEDGTVHVRDGRTLEILHSLRMPSASHAIGGWFAGDGRIIVTASADGLVRVWHATSGHVLSTVDAVGEGKLFGAAFAGAGEGGEGLVAVASLRSVDLWRPGGGDVRVFAGGQHSAAVYHPGELSGDGRRLAVTRIPRDGPPELQVFDVERGELVASWQETGVPYSLALSRDGGRVVVADLASKAAPRVRDASSGALLFELTGHEQRVYNLALSRDDRLVATVSDDRTVRQWRLADGQPVGPVIRLEVGPTAVAFDPAGGRLAVAQRDGTVRLFDRESGAELAVIRAHSTWIQDVEFSADGRKLVTGCRQEHLAKVFDLEHPERKPVLLEGHTDNVIRASFSPDGSMVATSSMDDTARLWDAESGDSLRVLAGATQTAAFTPDGAGLVCTGYRDFAVVYALAVDGRDPQALLQAAKAVSPWRLAQGPLELAGEGDGEGDGEGGAGR